MNLSGKNLKKPARYMLFRASRSFFTENSAIVNDVSRNSYSKSEQIRS